MADHQEGQHHEQQGGSRGGQGGKSFSFTLLYYIAGSN